MKRMILILSAFIIVLLGCNTITSELSRSSSSVISSLTGFMSSAATGSNESSFEGESSFWTNISGTFIDYVGGKELNIFIKEVETAKEPSGYTFFIHFCMYFKLTREEILSVMYQENDILARMGDKAYYSESRMKEVMKILFGDENIELKQPVNVLTKTSEQYGLIFGDTEFSDAKDIDNPLYYSIPAALQNYVGVRQINQWATGLEKREDYNIINYVRYFDVPADVFDNAIQVLNHNANVQNAADGTPILLDQKIYDHVRLELYGKTQKLSEISLPDAVYKQSSAASSLPWNTPEEKSAYYAASEALMAQSHTNSDVSSTVTSR